MITPLLLVSLLLYKFIFALRVACFARGLLSLLSFLRAFLRTAIKRNQANGLQGRFSADGNFTPHRAMMPSGASVGKLGLGILAGPERGVLA